MGKQAIFFSGGSIDAGFATGYLDRHPADLLVAVDRGLEFCYKEKIHPDLIVGDFDSLPAGILEHYEQDPTVTIRRLIPEKDDSDSESAMHAAMELGVDAIDLLGATGTRLDHIQANIQLLGYAYQRGVRIRIVDAHNCVSIAESGMVLKKEEQFGRFVSFFAYSEVVEELTLTGFKYPLTKHHLTNMSCGLTLSNEIVEEEARVVFSSGMLLMIQSCD